jgi:hypothetical protein
VAKKRRPVEPDWIAADLPVVGEIKDCRQISKTHWEGIDAANDALLRVRGVMPEKLRLLAFHQGVIPVGTIRLIPAAA